MQCKNITVSVLFGLLVVSGLSIAVHTSQAAPVDYPVSLFCRPDKGKVDLVGAFAQTKGEALSVRCEISNSSKDKIFSAFLLGKQVFEGQTLASTGEPVTIKESETVDITLTFPAVFQGGEYQDTFSLIDPSTAQPLAHDAYLLGTIEGGKKAVRIESATFDRERYMWQDAFQLTVNLDATKDAELGARGLSFHLTLDGATGEECAVLEEKKAVTGGTETLNLVFPAEGACANQMTLSLRADDGSVVDQKILAVGLPEKKPIQVASTGMTGEMLAKVPGPVLLLLVITGVLILGLTGFLLMRKKP